MKFWASSGLCPTPYLRRWWPIMTKPEKLGTMIIFPDSPLGANHRVGCKQRLPSDQQDHLLVDRTWCLISGREFWWYPGCRPGLHHGTWSCGVESVGAFQGLIITVIFSLLTYYPTMFVVERCGPTTSYGFRRKEHSDGFGKLPLSEPRYVVGSPRGDRVYRLAASPRDGSMNNANL